ncbi:MAG: hypothetical protein HRS57_01365 [Mycoplasmataceae bacterium]|nr:hypothetical protein [Mycoplasmataceae bacterium]
MSKNNLKEISLLYDFYGSLITEKRKEIFELYYFNDLTMNEISLKYSITKSAVSDSIKATIKSLNNFEQHLKLIEKHLKRIKLISSCEDDICKKLLEIEYE